MSSREEAGSPNRRDEGSNAGCLALQSGEEVTVLSGALVAASPAENGWWCVQYAGGDPQLVPHEYATALTEGFHLGVKNYHEYRGAQRELAVCLAEVDAEAEAG